jgi:putative transposase
MLIDPKPDVCSPKCPYRDQSGRHRTGPRQGRRQPCTSIRYANRLADAGPVASLGDSCDNALAETVVGLCTTECVRHDGAVRGVDDLELATLTWSTGSAAAGCTAASQRPADIPPVEDEHDHYRRTAALTDDDAAFARLR